MSAELTPDGWKWVPVEPAYEMVNQGTITALEHRLEGKHRSQYSMSNAGEVYAAYRAMIAAAPQPPAPSTDAREGDMLALTVKAINSEARAIEAEQEGEDLRDICAGLLAWADALAVKHPQQAELRERARAALSTAQDERGGFW
jgi:hypothetical protein